MKSFLASTLAVLAVGSAAGASTLTVPTLWAVGYPDGQAEVPIFISGGRTDVQAITLYVHIPIFTHQGSWGSGITNLNLKTGTVLQPSTFVVDPPVLLDTSGNGAMDTAANDYSMHFGGLAVGSGLAGTVAINVMGLWPGVYDILLEVPGLEVQSIVTHANQSVPTTLVHGSFYVGGEPPEPATAMLLLASVPLLRRRGWRTRS